MIFFESIIFFYFLILPSSIIIGQSTNSLYTAYQTGFQVVTSCPSYQYYDIALLQCSNCPANATQKSTGNKSFFKIYFIYEDIVNPPFHPHDIFASQFGTGDFPTDSYRKFIDTENQFTLLFRYNTM
jgi:hypothetical protein